MQKFLFATVAGAAFLGSAIVYGDIEAVEPNTPKTDKDPGSSFLCLAGGTKILVAGTPKDVDLVVDPPKEKPASKTT